MRHLGQISALALAIACGPVVADEQGKRGEAVDLPDAAWEQMQGVSWHSGLGCPDRAELQLLIVPYWDFDGAPQTGQMVVATDVAQDVLDIFAQMHAERFPIHSIIPVHLFEGNDDLSMAANNTSGFNCRMTSSGSRLSEHSFGRAIDINPVQNPYVTKKTTLPPTGGWFDEPSERAEDHAGMIKPGDVVVTAFEAKGWKWGGNWRSLKDYQHFSTTGR